MLQVSNVNRGCCGQLSDPDSVLNDSGAGIAGSGLRFDIQLLGDHSTLIFCH
jgi:hypothetical protein